MLTATFDLDWIRNYRNSWGVFRDRRPELYGPDHDARRPAARRSASLPCKYFVSLSAGRCGSDCCGAAYCGATPDARVQARRASRRLARSRVSRLSVVAHGKSRPVAARERFPRRAQDQLYEGVKQIDWQEHMRPRATIAIDFGGRVERYHAHPFRRAEDQGRHRRSIS